MKTKIIINVYSRQCASASTPIIIQTKDYASYEDAMRMANFKAKKINKKDYDVLITSI